VKSLPPRLLVCKELAVKGGLPKPLPGNRYGAPISFEKEVRNLPAFRCVREAEAEDTIRLNPEGVELLAFAHIDPPERCLPKRASTDLTTKDHPLQASSDPTARRFASIHDFAAHLRPRQGSPETPRRPSPGFRARGEPLIRESDRLRPSRRLRRPLVEEESFRRSSGSLDGNSLTSP